MKKLREVTLVMIAILLLFPGCIGHNGLRVGDESSVSPSLSVVRVNVTTQKYNFHRPWQQTAPVTKTAIGVIIRDHRVLVTSQFLENHRYIELEKIDSGKKGGARVDIIDYEANLALISPEDPGFLKDMSPLDLTVDAIQGDLLTILQVQRNGNVTLSQGPITSIELIPYRPWSLFLAYRMNNSLQYRFNNFTLPVVFKGKLAGLLMHYDSEAQTVDVVAAPIIDHFLKDAETLPYEGFPRAGINFVTTEDPQLRRYMGIEEDGGGVYVQKVVKGSGADKAGLEEGDIIKEIDRFPIDSHGNYQHPIYGKLNLSHLTRCHFRVGDLVRFNVFREGKELEFKIALEHRNPDDYLVPPYIIDKPPRYLILGGMVLEELSIPYLLEYGSNWMRKAPAHLVHYAENGESFDEKKPRKIVFLTSVLPTSFTIGYERLKDLLIERINGKVIERLEDVAEALKNPLEGFHKIEFRGPPRIVFLDPKEISDINLQLRRRYNIQRLRNLK
jgi:hypothetical protein